MNALILYFHAVRVNVDSNRKDKLILNGQSQDDITILHNIF